MNDATRTLILVYYDTCNPRRLYRVHKYLLGYPLPTRGFKGHVGRVSLPAGIQSTGLPAAIA